MSTVNDLKPGKFGVVRKIDCSGKLKHRIADMGITPGAVVFMKRTAPFGDPIQISVRGYNLSIRKSEAQRIEIDIIERK